MTLQIVQTGTWLYAGEIETPVDIISLDYDWGYSLDEADDQLEVGQLPEPLNSDGCLYYVRFKRALELTEPTWADSAAYSNLADAILHAESMVAGGIRWGIKSDA